MKPDIFDYVRLGSAFLVISVAVLVFAPVWVPLYFIGRLVASFLERSERSEEGL